MSTYHLEDTKTLLKQAKQLVAYQVDTITFNGPVQVQTWNPAIVTATASYFGAAFPSNVNGAKPPMRTNWSSYVDDEPQLNPTDFTSLLESIYHTGVNRDTHIVSQEDLKRKLQVLNSKTALLIGPSVTGSTGGFDPPSGGSNPSVLANFTYNPYPLVT